MKVSRSSSCSCSSSKVDSLILIKEQFAHTAQLRNDDDCELTRSLIDLLHSHAAGNVVMENEDAESSSNSTPRYRPDVTILPLLPTNIPSL